LVPAVGLDVGPSQADTRTNRCSLLVSPLIVWVPSAAPSTADFWMVPTTWMSFPDATENDPNISALAVMDPKWKVTVSVLATRPVVSLDFHREMVAPPAAAAWVLVNSPTFVQVLL
jgi:hypothetical protein